METAWFDDKTKISDDWVRRNLGKVLPNLWATPRRDKFRSRLEKGAEPGTTEVFVSNRNLEEIYTDTMREKTAWQPGPADRDLEAEMLSRMMAKIGMCPDGGEHQAPTPVRAGQAPVPAEVAQCRAGELWRRPAGGERQLRARGGVWPRTRPRRLHRRGSRPLRDSSSCATSIRKRTWRRARKESWSDKLMFWKSTPKGSQPR
jgi:outer membrane protein assembly factor BamC